MLDRGAFLTSAASALAAAAVGSPLTSLAQTSSPGPTATPAPPLMIVDGFCTRNKVLPYDRPLELKMRVLDGPEFDLMNFRGNVVWLNIFATWCGPCNSEQPGVVAVSKKYFARGLRVIGIDAQESDNTVRDYRKKYGIDYPIAMDENGGFTGVLEQGANAQQSYPAHLLINRFGFLSCYIQGSLRKPDDIVFEIEKLLGAPN